MSHSSAQRIITQPRPVVRPAAPRHLRSVKRTAAPQVQWWHVLAVTLAVGLLAVCTAIALRPAPTAETTVTWTALPDEAIDVVAAPASTTVVAAPAPAKAVELAHAVDSVSYRTAPAKRRAGASLFDDPDAKEDLTVGRALPKDAKPTDRVSREEFRLALASQNGGR